jgi:hypothetical protein
MIEIIGLLVIIVVLFYIWTDGSKDNEGKIIDSIICLVFPLVLTFIVGMFLSLAFTPVEVGRINHQIDIISLRNESNINGNFVLGSGYVNNIQRFYTYYKDPERGGYRQTWFQADNCDIFQDGNKYITWQNIVYRQSKYILIWPKITWKEDTRYDIHVPTNTIISTFNLN